jgi:hypothetical protein
MSLVVLRGLTLSQLSVPTTTAQPDGLTYAARRCSPTFGCLYARAIVGADA